MTGTCKYCGCQLHKMLRAHGDGWVDNSGGDVCGVDGDNKPHTDILDDEFVIVSTVEEEDGAPLYWKNEDGWGYREDATVFSEYEKGLSQTSAEHRMHLPVDCRWEKLVEAKGQFSILYTSRDRSAIMQCGPFKNEQEAMKYVRGHCYTEGCNEYEFDLNDQHVYLLHPDHRMIELSVSVLSESV